MKVKVDFRKCTKSGECYYNYPELFKVGEDGFPVVQVAELSTDESPAFEATATPTSSAAPVQTPVLEDQARKTLEAGLHHMRFEAQREFNGLRERWLDGRAESLVQRIEHIADGLQASRATQ